MELILIILALVTLCYFLFTAIEFKIGFKQIKNLSSQPFTKILPLPRISIIFSALNEEAAIEETINTLFKLDYPDYEIIAVNDRSTDQTPHILDSLKQRYPHLQVHHISKLPQGWFGKNHALHVAAGTATGEWLLFTDADVIMKPQTLSRSMSYALEKKLDHLTLFEHHSRHDFWLRVSLLGSYIAYTLAMRPWRVRFAWSKRSLGHGAFNLIRKEAYEACNGHAAIALQCLDDMRLGALLKKNGFRQDTVNGQDFVEREWYGSLAEMVAGMRKNSFAYFDYRLLPALRDSLYAVIFTLWPLLAVLVCRGLLQYLNFAIVMLSIYLGKCVAKEFRLPQWFAVFYPLALGITIYTLWGSIISVYRHKGVIWRGTHYSLQMLKYPIS
jgi:cellulose synthase/poly-beta-1,6-N-acetylglucosamine synthase-like glycosyltransferase